MALKKTITERNGISAEYHKINGLKVGSKYIRRDRVEVEKDGVKTFEIVEVPVYGIVLTLASYVSQELREKSHGLSVKEQEYHFTVPSADFETQPLYLLAYAELKKLEAFEGAEDC